MESVKNRSLDLSYEARSRADAEADRLRDLWQRLCDRYLPIRFDDSIWRHNRESKSREPSQGWKLHISATILEACDLFEKVAPFLISRDVQFKAPNSLDVLSDLNCGLQYGYHQVGKFITIYPSAEKQAVELAENLHKLTKSFFPISVPFDEQYAAGSSVFYRYGGFSKIDVADENGETFLAIENSSGELVKDDRLTPYPEWISDPFPNGDKPWEKTFAQTPLGETYQIFRAISQRGKGGTYEAFDFSREKPRLCIVKQGRLNGELGWNGQDGYFLVQNEFNVLRALKQKYGAVPQVFSSFEVHGNFYFAMEYVEGPSLNDIMRHRRKRFSIRQVLHLALEIVAIIEKIHRAGWVWNDCKPANLIFTNEKHLRPIDFENAYPVDRSEPFDWKSKGFSKDIEGNAADIFALGAVAYYLISGQLYDDEKPLALENLRRNVPPELVKITEALLSDTSASISKIRKELEKIQKNLK